MLTILGLTMITVFTYFIMSGRLSSFTALTAIPLLFAIIGGFASEVDDMMLDGIKLVATSAAFLLFALLFFGIMIDAGMFDPLINKILKVVKGDPLKVAMGTAILTLLVALDGDGTTTFMIVISSMLPLYKKLNMNPLVLATISMLSFSVVCGLTPWGGPGIRALSVLGLEQADFFIPLIPTLIGGAIWVVFVSFILGKMERKRLGIIDLKESHISEYAFSLEVAADKESSIKRPKMLWVNILLTLVVMTVLVLDLVKPAILFLIAVVIAMFINYPSIDQQKDRIKAHGGNALMVLLVVFAGGAFTGILSGTKMIDSIAGNLVSILPESWGQFFPVIIGLVSIPFTFVMSNDAFYFGVVPIFANTASAYGIEPIEIVRAVVLSQSAHFLLPLVPATILLTGMLKLNISEYVRFAFKWSVLTCLVLISLAWLTGAIMT
ncbi:CitMHS family transporter [Priestia megaterium]|uniref:CitMHS family transporter n=1 Tax=Priestia megaterium TaxID=1404 RepID=UPI0020426308|nr:citrate:proton symporter [Priestia megaterium]MCM3196520.1 citrate:proton symporter [Priestia megaterium]MEC1071329.1 citrate:proton symporter [Priestia megaterium]